MEPGRSFSEFMIAAEAALGSKPDPDRAYEAFSLGVSPKVFVEALAKVSSTGQDGSSTPAQTPPRSSQVAPFSNSFQLTERPISPRRRLLVIALVIMILSVILSVWIPSNLGNSEEQNEVKASSQTRSTDQLQDAKVSLRQAIDSGVPEVLRSALSNAERTTSSANDQELVRLIAEARGVEKAWKGKQQSFDRFEKDQLTSAAKTSNPEKSTSPKSGSSPTTSR